MKPKQIIILSLILGILAIGILLKSWIRSSDESVDPVRSKEAPVAEFDPAKVERVLISGGTRTPDVELVKEKGSWKVKSLWNAEADPSKVEAFLQKLRSARGELRGTGKKLFPDFGIQDTTALSIRLLGAGGVSLADLRLGRKKAGQEGYFIRSAAGEDVYLVDLKMAELLGIFMDFEKAVPASGFWADLNLFHLNPEKVTKITIYHLKGDQKTLGLGMLGAADPQDPVKKVWKFLRAEMSSPIDPEKLLKFITVLSSIRAQAVMDPAGKDYGVEKPVWQMAVTEGNRKILLNAGPKAAKEDLYYVKTSLSPSVFSLSSGYFDDLNVDDTRFVKETAPAAGSKKKI
jgi:hypothetical protein